MHGHTDATGQIDERKHTLALDDRSGGQMLAIRGNLRIDKLMVLGEIRKRHGLCRYRNQRDNKQGRKSDKSNSHRSQLRLH